MPQSLAKNSRLRQLRSAILTGLMKCNVSKTGRAFRLLIGIAMMAWAVAGGPAWTWVGLLVAATGAWRLCPILSLFGAGQNDRQLE